METHEFTPIGFGLTEQQSDSSDKACTAYSLVNLLKLLGESVSQEQVSGLKEKAVAQEPTGLNPTQIAEFLSDFGYKYKYLGHELAETATDKAGFLEEFLKRVKEKPLSFTISSALTLRKDPTSRSGAQDIGSRGIGHQVVANYENERVRIIDPYAPNSGLFSFQQNNPDSMSNLLAVVTSSASQYYLGQDSKPITRESVFEEGLKRLDSESCRNFINAALSINNMYTAVKS